MEEVLTGEYVGVTELSGVRCHHLAFRSGDVDWQIWIEDGDKPLPRKTARRTSYRHHYYPRPVVYGAGAVAATATAIAIGTRVASLPSGCRNVTVNGRLYYDCSETYYQPQYDGPDVI